VKREKLNLKIDLSSDNFELWVSGIRSVRGLGINPLEKGIIEGENPVCDSEHAA